MDFSSLWRKGFKSSKNKHMKKIYIRVLFVLFPFFINAQTPIINPVCNVTGVSPLTPPVCNTNPWTLVYWDDFNGVTLDSRKWETKTGVPYDFSFSMQKQWYQPQNVRIDNGSMIIDIIKELLPNKTFDAYDPNIGVFQVTSDFDYSSGFVSSKYMFTHGQLEFKCNIPWVKGLWPASWLFGTSSNGAINDEIDNFEFIFDNNPVEHLMTQHYNGMHCPAGYHAANLVNSWHTFNVIWSPYNIEWYVDGNLKRIDYLFSSVLGQGIDCPNVPFNGTTVMRNNVWPKDPMLIYSNVAVRNGSGNIPPDPTTWPLGDVHMEVDYIKYFQRLPCGTNVNIRTLSNFTNGNFFYPVYKTALGSQVYMWDNCTLANPQKQLELVARDLVQIRNDVHITYGTKFTARIDPTTCPGVPLEGPPTEPIEEPEPESFQGRNDHNNPLKDVNTLEAYPNPAQNEVHLKGADQVGPYTITIVDMLGRVVKEVTIQSSTDPINLSGLSGGVYSCRISTANRIIGVKKITIRD